MNSIPIVDPSELIHYLNLARVSRCPLFLRGGPGVGKSSIFRQFAEAQGPDFRYFDDRALYRDPTALHMPAIDLKAGLTRWLPSDEFPRDGSGIWVVEELPSAPPLTQAAYYQLILDRCIGHYKVPDGWMIVATGNRLSDRAVVNRMPSPLVSRFWHLELDASVDDWSRWAISAGIDHRLIAYFRHRPANLQSFKPKEWEQDTPYCCPRTVEYLSNLIKANETIAPGTKPPLPLFISTIGQKVGMEVYGFFDIYGTIPSREQILLDPDNCPVPDKASSLLAVITQFVNKVDAKNLGRLLRYWQRLPREFAAMAVRDHVTGNSSLSATPEFTEFALSNPTLFQ